MRSRHILISLQQISSTFALLVAVAATSRMLAAPGDLLFKITAPDPQAGAGFGEMLAVIDGDILVAEPNRTLGLGINAVGRAYLFDGKSGALKRTFNNPAPMNLDDFARAITGGDGRVLISTSGTESRVFSFDAATGQLLHTLRSPDDGDGFGAAMAYDAGKLLVSDPSFSLNAQQRTVGRAYMFNAINGELIRSLPNPEPNPGDLFGTGAGSGSLAIFGSSAIIGASFDDLPGDTSPETDDSGRVWLFDLSSGNTKFVIENPNPEKPPPNHIADRFGSSVAATEKAIVVGAQEDDWASIEGSGTVYVFDSKTGALRHTLIGPQIEVNGEFGRSVAVTGDGNVLVGAWNTSVGGVTSAGHAYLFDGVTGSLLLDIPNPEPTMSSVFGWSLTALDNRVIVGAPAPGSVYVFEGIPEPSTLVSALIVVGLLAVPAVRKFRHCTVSLKGLTKDNH